MGRLFAGDPIYAPHTETSGGVVIGARVEAAIVLGFGKIAA